MPENRMLWVKVLIDEDDYWSLVEQDGGPVVISSMSGFNGKGEPVMSMNVYDISLEQPRYGHRK